jgi:uncharacterized protein YfbU (UPF0304 family)
MAQLNVRLDDDARESFDALARARGLSTSDLIRILIDDALGRTSEDRRAREVAPVSLSAVQRHGLALQHEILARLTANPGEKDGGWESQQHRRIVTVLQSGFTAEYSEMFSAFDLEITVRECSLVHDILQMCSMLEQSIQALSAEERAALGEHAEHALGFRGFDFNDSHEARLASYAQHLVKTGRWEEMRKHFDRNHERGNSHSPRLASYQRMLTAWRPIQAKKIANWASARDVLLTPAELQTIHDAWPYP